MSLFTICNISLWGPQNVSVKFQLKVPTDHLLYYFENAYFEWKQKHTDFRACFFKSKWAAAPAPFPE